MNSTATPNPALPRPSSVSVKSGRLKADDVRALEMVRKREAAELAFLVTLEPPRKGMAADAASAGFYKSANGKEYARVQVLTIEGLMTGTQRPEHPDYAPVNFKQAKRETSGPQTELL